MARLGDLTWQELADSPVSILLIPVGATEQHGPHLPLDTDTVIATAVADRVGNRLDTAVVAPALAYGSSGEHAGFAGTLSIGQDALEEVLVELVRSSSDTLTLRVFVNGHGGNLDPVRRAARRCCEEGRRTIAWFPSVDGGDAHAGKTETSLMLALGPERVRLDQAQAGERRPLRDLVADLRAGGVAAVSANGVLGDPTGASVDLGERLLAELSDQLHRAVLDALDEDERG